MIERIRLLALSGQRATCLQYRYLEAYKRPMKRVIVLLASAAIEGESGLLFPPHKADALVNALNRLLSEPYTPPYERGWAAARK